MSVRLIAKNLSVSPSTVSLALNNSPKIPEVTQRRVLDEAMRIGYCPNGNVRELMSEIRRSSMVRSSACMGVFSFYEGYLPWERSDHLAAIFESMSIRARELGYRLEAIPFFGEGMSPKRFTSILDARGIKGVLCFGSPDFEQVIPDELDHFAIVSIGLSIRTPLHRVTSHYYNDLQNALNRVYERGYRRPGLVLGEWEETRSQFAYSAAYYGWCKQRLGQRDSIPVLKVGQIEAGSLLSWYHSHKPDVILAVHLSGEVYRIPNILNAAGLRIPDDVGLAAVTQLLRDGAISGKQQNQKLIGEWAVEMLESRMTYRDYGIPEYPRIEMVESSWVEGQTLKIVSG